MKKLKELINLLFFGAMAIIVSGCTYQMFFNTKTSWVILPFGLACLAMMVYGFVYSLKNLKEL